MNPLAALIVNAARRVEAMFPGYFPEAKHDHYRDFGWPVSLTFAQLHGMYRRNSLAKAAVSKTVLKTWQTAPEVWETEEPKETPLEEDIRRRFSELRLWGRFAEADRRGMVGGYAGLILRLADGKRFSEPAGTVPGGLAGLVEVIPAWAGQLTVAEWGTDETAPDYGQPRMFQFNEAEVAEEGQIPKTRSLTIHPDRVIIVSADGTVHCDSALLAGYNDLLTLEKVSGAGGEGFWKNAKSAPVFEVDKDAKLQEMAAAMGVPLTEVADAMNEQVADWQKGFDKLLMVQGMEAKALGITLPSPEHFFNIALQSFAASFQIPLKVLVGNQTGERASSEDNDDWAQANMARREDSLRPTIMSLLARLVRFGILPERDWHLHWADLTEATMAEKIERAGKMADINQKLAATGELAFLPEELRAVVDMEPLGKAGLLDGDDDEPEDEPKDKADPPEEDDET